MDVVTGHEFARVHRSIVSCLILFFSFFFSSPARVVWCGVDESWAAPLVHNMYQVTATKPDWAVGASASLKRPVAAVTAAAPSVAAPVTTAPAKKAWSIALTDDVDLIDQDALLAKETDKVVVTKKDPVDCGTGAVGLKKACKDCSCGLKDMETGDDAAPVAPKTSACGSVRTWVGESTFVCVCVPASFLVIVCVNGIFMCVNVCVCVCVCVYVYV
jgi:hypothetical protein